MMQAEQDDIAPPAAPNAERVPLATLLAELRDDAVAYASAQADLIKVTAAEKSRALAIWVGVILVASVLVFAALAAAIFGLMQVLAPWLGLGWAVLMVTIGAAAIAAALGWFAIGRIRQLFSRTAK